MTPELLIQDDQRVAVELQRDDCITPSLSGPIRERPRDVNAFPTAEALAEHEAMGFHEGWVKAADQLEALAKSL